MNTSKRSFRLYPEERHWWSFNDYGAVLDVMERLKPKTVLEFGPGSSTLALIEGGATHIDTCEDNPEWAAVYRQRLETVYANIVHLHEYEWKPKIEIPALMGKHYDMALIDGPYGTPQRPASVEYALNRCAAVLVPTEEWRDGKAMPERGLRGELERLARKHKRMIEVWETGPLSGAFALLT